MKKIGKVKAEKLIKNGAFLVDMRSPVAYRDGHVAGSVNMPLSNLVKSIMGFDRKRPVIIYSDVTADIGVVDNYASQLGFESFYLLDYEAACQM